MQAGYKFGRGSFRTFEEGLEREWLLTNGIGGLANMTITGAQSRMHSCYLTASFHAPSDRKLLLANIHDAIVTGEKEYNLTTQQYTNEKIEGQYFLNSFELDGVPTYTYQVDDIVIKKTIGMEYGYNTTAVEYKLCGGRKPATIFLTPLFNYRDPGSVSEKADLVFEKAIYEKERLLVLTPKKAQGQHRIMFYVSEGNYLDRSLRKTSMATPNYVIEENDIYEIDSRNGFKGVDNHLTPYDITIELAPYEKKTVWVICSGICVENKDMETNVGEYLTSIAGKSGSSIIRGYKNRIYNLMENINSNDRFLNRLVWAADNFIVSRESTGLKTILAGYPWFLDWGRDTMIALQGLTLCTGRYDDCRQVLESFSKYVKNGMLPNVFANHAQDEPGYNTIDASLWYFYSVEKYLEYTGDYKFIKDKIYPCLVEIINAYERGTDFQIKMDQDGLIQGGSDLDQLTWMDVRVGDLVVTPRHGKPVEINALWYNALVVMENLSQIFKEDSNHYRELSYRVKESFCSQFWNEKAGCLYDVVNGETKDGTIRPNQIYAVSLPHTMLSADKEKNIVGVVYEELYTPYGIRSLSNRNVNYKKDYIGKLINRDLAYHMGTAWAFISGAFITAYCKVNNYENTALKRAKDMCEYFEQHMEDGCINGIAEIFDGDFSATGRGCYSQAWSVGEILRAYKEDVLDRISQNK